jgi:hypothetical protein
MSNRPKLRPSRDPDPFQRAIEYGADVALAGLSRVLLAQQDVMIVPDTLIIEGIANGLPDPGGTVLERGDGRSVRVLRQWLSSLPRVRINGLARLKLIKR